MQSDNAVQETERSACALQRRNEIRKVAVGILIPLIGFWYQTAMAGSPISGAKDGVAIQGFDTVAYFTEAKAVKGSPRLAHEWAGTVWFFATIENRDAFASQPEKYAPQYGGHCALSVANGKDAKGSGRHGIYTKACSISTPATTCKPGGCGTSLATSPAQTSNGQASRLAWRPSEDLLRM
jgi:YHS domain-containing protein